MKELTPINYKIALALQELQRESDRGDDLNFLQVIATCFGRYNAGCRVKTLARLLEIAHAASPSLAIRMAIDLTVGSKDEVEQDWAVPLLGFAWVHRAHLHGQLTGEEHYLLNGYGNQWDFEYQKKRSGVHDAVGVDYTRDFWDVESLVNDWEFPTELAQVIVDWIDLNWPRETT